MGGRGAGSGMGISKTAAFKFKESDLPKLTGSEKQVKWANQIRNDAINTINRNIETASKRFDDTGISLFKNTKEAYEEIGRQIKDSLSGVTKAEQIIDRRHIIDPRRIIKAASEIEEMRKKSKK